MVGVRRCVYLFVVDVCRCLLLLRVVVWCCCCLWLIDVVVWLCWCFWLRMFVTGCVLWYVAVAFIFVVVVCCCLHCLLQSCCAVC